MAIANTNELKQISLSRVSEYPRFRYMGSKHKLTPFLWDVFSGLRFQTSLDGFAGSGIVSYLLKVMGKQVCANDYLTFPGELVRAMVVNQGESAQRYFAQRLSENVTVQNRFIQRTFQGLYFEQQELEFLDRVWAILSDMSSDSVIRSAGIAALCLAAVRKQTRGVFTVTEMRYDDGRRDLRMSMQEQFERALTDIERVAFADGRAHHTYKGDIFDAPTDYDLVYLDPPYMPKTDDNDYVKRYHFLEGLATYWRGETIMEHTKTKKIAKKHTRFGQRLTIENTFDDLFRRFADSIIVCSYSSNALPDIQTLTKLMRKYKTHVTVESVSHRYSFGNHENVEEGNNLVDELVIVGE